MCLLICPEPSWSGEVIPGESEVQSWGLVGTPGALWGHERREQEEPGGGHCPVPPSQAGRSPRCCRFSADPSPATAAGEAGGAAL